MRNQVFVTPELSADDIEGMRQLFSDFQSFYGKEYGTESDVEYRFQVFQNNYSEALSLRERYTSATFGVNQFSDMTDEEFKNLVSTPLSGDVPTDHLEEFHEELHEGFLEEPQLLSISNSEGHLKNDVDWRLSKCMGPIKSQETCNACYTMTANAIIETLDCSIQSKVSPSAVVFDATKKTSDQEALLSPLAFEPQKDASSDQIIPSSHLSPKYSAFSEQYLVNCDDEQHDPYWIAVDKPFPRAPTKNYACMGGFTGYSLNFYQNHKFAILQKDIPYVVGKEMCKEPAEEKKFSIERVVKNSKIVKAPRKISELRKLLKVTPVAVSLCSSLPVFKHYTGGVLEDLDGKACWNEIKGAIVTDHAVPIVGIHTNSTTGNAEFIFRNSWGATQWGEGGYGRLRARDLQNTGDSGDFGWGIRAIGLVRSGRNAFADEAVERF
eukprot:GDKJ01019968.1.p1 GENE.GDKJ01019968.1~~GDKJ01019968.1.p1  ORF type:complete len:438 (-),score=84.63 GDKJ01019968.1:163-1476(-)